MLHGPWRPLARSELGSEPECLPQSATPTATYYQTFHIATEGQCHRTARPNICCTDCMLNLEPCVSTGRICLPVCPSTMACLCTVPTQLSVQKQHSQQHDETPRKNHTRQQIAKKGSRGKRTHAMAFAKPCAEVLQAAMDRLGR